MVNPVLTPWLKARWPISNTLKIGIFWNSRSASKHPMVFMSAAAYQQLAEQTEAPLHLGVTEAGAYLPGTVKSAIGLGNLLWPGLVTLTGVTVGRPCGRGESWL